MPKRVYEIAKELNKTSKDVIDTLKLLGMDKKAVSNLDDDEIKKLKNSYNPLPKKTLAKTIYIENKNNNDKNKMSDDKRLKDNKQQNRNRNSNSRYSDKPKTNDDRRNAESNRGQQIRRDGSKKTISPEIKKKFFSKEGQDGLERKNFNRTRQDSNRTQQNRDGKNRTFNNRQGQFNKDDNGYKRGFNKDNQGFDKKNQSDKSSFNKRNDKSFSNKDNIDQTLTKNKANNRKLDSKKANKKNDYKKSKKEENHIGLEKIQKNINKKTAKKKNLVSHVEIPENITLQEFAQLIKVQASQLIKKLFMDGKIYTINDVIDFDTAEEIALEYDITVEKEITTDVIEELLREKEDPEEALVNIPPVVCVMGHVDHGKTSLLDAIRNTNAVSKESGGITQHIGASQVIKNDKIITFLDTPGHEAFISMRLRGAQSTNIAILVVAADDGVMPQTIEAINHAKAAGIEIIVAINKIDKPAANIERVKSDLAEYGVVVSDWGGDVDCVPVSAHTGEGIDDLLDMVLLTAEVLDLKANPNRNARGVVLEAKMDPKKGKVASLLVQKGTLKVGDPIAVGSACGKVRSMINFKGQKIKEAGPSTPVEITGLNEIANAGDTFIVTDSDKEAKNFAETYVEEERKKMLEATKGRMSLDDLFKQIKEGSLKELNIVVKADVQGSVEALKQSLEKLSNDEVVIKIIHGGVGTISESDVILASASNAIIIGFNVKIDSVASDIVSRDNIDCRLYSVIYKAIEDVQDAMNGMLEPVFEEKVQGKLIVRQIFKASGVGIIAGCFVESGIITNKSKIRLYRNNKVIYDGELSSLKRFKDEAKEVKMGFECGIVLDNFEDIQVDDTLETYIMVEVERKL